MMYIKSYTCLSSAGQGSEALWTALSKGVITRAADGVSRIKGGGTLANRLLSCWDSLENKSTKRLGVIYASTKGCIEDFIWKGTDETLSRDPLTPVLESFLTQAHLLPVESVCVSNACASSHGA